MNRPPEAWKMLRNLRKSDTCVVIGNGPSLQDVPLSFLHKYDSFGSNRIYMLPFSPMFYACVNPLVLDQFSAEISHLDSQAKFIAESHSELVPGCFSLHSGSVPTFSREPWRSIYEGFTVTYVLLQLAFFIGYDSVLMIGVDHRYLMDGRPNEQTVRSGDDPNHFHPDYFGKGSVWNNPDLASSERSYHMAKSVFEDAGKRIINLTPNSALDVFDKAELADYL